MSIASFRCRNRNNSPNQLHRNHLLRPCRPPRPRRRRNRAEDRGARAPALAYREARSASFEQSRGRRRGPNKAERRGERRDEAATCCECGSFTLVRNGTCMKCDTCGSTSATQRRRHRCVGADEGCPSRVVSCPFRRLSDVHWKDFLPGAKRVERERETPPATAGFSLGGGPGD
jgi:hypothetical protein